jgi:predicted metalloprotease with PDZ domain
VLEYLAELSLVRGGLLRAGTYWQTGIEAHINTLQRDSSRLQVSVVDAGARRYQEPPQGQPRRPAGPDPTVKGLLLGLLLDVEIRTRSAGRRSLDGAVQGLLGRRAPVSNASIQAACEAVAGGKLDGFFNRFVTGTEELPLTATLARVGLVAAPVSTGEGDAPVNPRMPKPRPRPPRWRVTLDPQATEQTQQLRAAMTEVVVK